jgi:hypothetical protein
MLEHCNLSRLISFNHLNCLFMKRFFIILFVAITSIAILGLAKTTSVKENCSRNICCVKKCKKDQSKSPKTDYIFWEPIGRLIMVPR